MRIGIDIDGCVRDIHNKLVQVYKREMNKEGDWCDPPEKWANYNISPYFSIDYGIYDFWFRAHAKEIYTMALPFPDIGEIKKLHDDGHEIVVLTDQPNPATEEYTLMWVRKYLPYAKEIHFTPYKQFVSCDVYLDDAPHHINNIQKVGNIAIMDHRWNHGIENLKRVKNLKKFAEFAEGLL